MKTISLTTTFAMAILLVFANLNVNGQTTFELPFYEDWSSGSFETNQWQTDEEQWEIDTQTGNTAPSAIFNSIELFGYSENLMSNWLNAENIEVGKIFIKFSLKLHDLTEQGSEHFIVMVYDGQIWHTVDTISNQGSFDWTTYNYEISELALGNNFKIQFQATGMQGIQIGAWHIDNIEVYRECDSPMDLTGEVYWRNYPEHMHGSRVRWHPPESAIIGSGWQHWDSGENNSGIGASFQEIKVAIKWDAGMLSCFDGDTIEKVSFCTNDDHFLYVIIKLWTGENAETLIYSDTAQNVIPTEWNEHILSETVLIDADLELWVGYAMKLDAGWPLGTDEGPAVVGYGDLISLDGQTWDTMSNFGPDFNVNWNIQMYVDTVEMPYPQGLVGFDVFKKEPDEDEYFQIDFVNFRDGQSTYTIIDTCYDELYTCDAFYKVNALWVSDGDTCTSDFAPSLNNPEDDFVYVMFVDIEENEMEQSDLVAYPNPTSNTLRLKSEKIIYSVTIFNSLGQIVKRISPKGEKELSINVSSFKSGVYFLKAETEKGIVSKKFIKK